MIVDRIENSDEYCILNPNFKVAFDFLKKVKIEDFTEEKLKIDGDNVFAIINDYTTKDAEVSQLESHRKYIDIQYMLEGEELIGYSPLTNQVACAEYETDSDIMFFPDKPSCFIKLTPESYSILYPQDLHMPGIKVSSPAPIKKIVVKVKL
jgi:YhcH/YjgK/YiaL family protein